MSAKDRISEFVLALEEEIEILKSGKGGNVVSIFNGQYLRETGGFHIYRFNLENPLVVMDDTPAEFIYDSQRYNCQVVSSVGTEVLIGIEQFLGKKLYSAKLETNLWFLLELLQKKFEESKDKELKKYDISEKLFNGINSNNDLIHQPQYISDPSKPPNDSQIKAINSSFVNTLSIIWGPPGTGKTTTIALIVQALLNNDKRILLVSHANAAVDAALEEVAAQLEDTSYYNDGKLVRLGVHRKESLEKYPFVLMDKIEEELGKSLVEEREYLTNKISKLQESLNQFSNIRQKIALKSTIEQEVNSIEQSINKLRSEKRSSESQLKEYNSILSAKKSELLKAENTGKIKRVLLGLNPEKLQKDINNIILNVDTINRNSTSLRKKLAQGNDAYSKKTNQYKKLNQEISSLLSKFSLTPNDFTKKEASIGKEVKDLESRISIIDKSLSEIRKNILLEAKLVATTLTKTFSSKEFPSSKFDVVIIDESSMAPMPYMYWASSKANSNTIIVGDFLQLPPICVSRKDAAITWLKRSIYDQLEIDIDSVDSWETEDNFTLLDMQYRMHPTIAQIPCELFYKNRLKNGTNVNEYVYYDQVSGNNHLVVIDSSDRNPWCSQITSGGRFNIYNAFVTAKTVKKLFEDNHYISIGIISPYKAQVRLINKILKDWKLEGKFETATTHSFQGGEKDVILIDCVEGPGAKKWSMFNHADDAEKVLNVAFTRAKRKIYLIIHRDHIQSYFPPRSLFLKILNYFDECGISIVSGDIIDEEDFQVTVDDFTDEYTFNSPIKTGNGTPFSEQGFWPAFMSDLLNCKKSVIIVSPFTSMNRIGKMMLSFTGLINRGVEITAFILPPNYQGGVLIEHAENAIKLLTDWGVHVIQRKNIHQKIAIIDNNITWEGSLNILSHNKTIEHMRRFIGENTANEVIRVMDLDTSEAVNNYLDDLCPVCLEKGIKSPLVIRKSKYGKFKGCSAFPKCRYIEKNKK